MISRVSLLGRNPVLLRLTSVRWFALFSDSSLRPSALPGRLKSLILRPGDEATARIVAYRKRKRDALLEKQRLQDEYNKTITKETFMVKNEPKEEPGAMLTDWKAAHERFYGPERDMKNFPMFPMLDRSPDVYFTFIPQEWFHFFYPKTGVSGPYVFLFGFLMTVLSKEIWVVEHNFMELPSWCMALYLANHYLGGPQFRKYIYDHAERANDWHYYMPMRKIKAHYSSLTEHCDREISRVALQAHINQSLRENVLLQLDDSYRRRLATAYKDVKRKLDYHVEKKQSQQRMEHKHMVEWIERQVRESITPSQEKESIAKCIQDLAFIARNQQTASQ